MSLQRKALRFLQQSALSFIVNFGITIILHEVLGQAPEVAFAVALVIVFSMNFFLLRFYVYQGKEQPMVRQFMGYSGSAISFRGIEYLSFLILHTWLEYDYRLVIISILVVSSLFKFVWYRYLFEFKARDQQG